MAFHASGWLSTGVLLAFLVVFSFFQSDLSQSWFGIYWAVARASWGVGLAWLTGNGLWDNTGLIARILSWNGFKPLARLSLPAFLVQPLVSRKNI